MQTKQINLAGTQPAKNIALNKKDILTFDKHIFSALNTFVKIKNLNIIFPKNSDSCAASWLPTESKLILPLYEQEKHILAVIILRLEDGACGERLAALWQGVNKLISQNLLFFKQNMHDYTTGLISKKVLLEQITREIELLRLPFESNPKSKQEAHNTSFKSQANISSNIVNVESSAFLTDYIVGNSPQNTHKDLRRGGGFGLLVIRIAGLRSIIKNYGYSFFDKVLGALGTVLQSSMPEAVLAARTGDGEFAVLMPMSSSRQCQNLSLNIYNELDKLRITHPAWGEKIQIGASIGHVNFPADMEGALFRLPAYEQANILLRKARLAAALAKNSAMPNNAGVLGFGDILLKGGQVQDILPLGRIVLNIGSNTRVRQGLVFAVWGHVGQENICKGEVVVIEVQEAHAIAEVLHLSSPSIPFSVGDSLVLVAESQAESTLKLKQGDGLSKCNHLLSYGDFFSTWAIKRESCTRFVLSMLHFPSQEHVSELAQEKIENIYDTENKIFDIPEQQLKNNLQLAVDMCIKFFDSNILIGRYGLNSLILFHSEAIVEDIAKQYALMSKKLQAKYGMTMITGIAAHPYLDFRKADALENSRKALEYAKLLPFPHVGIMDSLALNISADKLFSQGETFAAIKEYQLAVADDENNGMAWNSLGICFACLGKFTDAERYFSRALACDSNDSMALYNLGYICQVQGQHADARQFYQKCLAKNPGHLFAIIRLGQLAENSEDFAQARQWYEMAKKLPAAKGVVERHFARLCLKENRVEESREHLHEALLADPYDAIAMQLLARVFLDAGEDPEMAASLARKSVQLYPTGKAGWLELARALHALGDEEHARAAERRAAEL